MRFPKDHKAKTREKILDAAATVFRRDGFAGAGVDAVMREAGLTAGGFYAHFPSKDAVAVASAKPIVMAPSLVPTVDDDALARIEPRPKTSPSTRPHRLTCRTTYVRLATPQCERHFLPFTTRLHACYALRVAAPAPLPIHSSYRSCDRRRR